ncbi:MAG: MFS transporter [Bacteroidia bacterium]
MRKVLNAAVIISALGYFIDVFDLLLFGVLRVKSLTSLGIPKEELVNAGITLQNWQMAGLLLGGIASGIIGDKFGRVRALYLSILLYSIATIMNGFVTNLELYAFCRFVAGIGLAGEIGAGITLVVESLPKENRGVGTTIVAAFGMMGAIAAGCMDWVISDWRTAYFLGGGLGIGLLLLRLSVAESTMFEAIKGQKGVKKGDFLALLNNRKRLGKLLKSTFLGVTTWFNVGILMILAPEFGAAKGITVPITAALSVVWFHVGMSIGDFASGMISQWFKSRLKAMRLFLAMQVLFVSLYLFMPNQSTFIFYALLTLLGFSGGFWAVFITNASEQFGTNLRATAASTIPSLVRGLFIPIAMFFKFLKTPEQLGSTVNAAAIVGVFCIGLAFWASFTLEDTFDKDLDNLEY